MDDVTSWDGPSPRQAGRPVARLSGSMMTTRDRPTTARRDPEEHRARVDTASNRPAGPGEGPVAYVGQNVNVTAAYRKSTSFDGPVSSMKSPEKKWA